MTRVFFITVRLPFPMLSGPDFRTWMIVNAVADTCPVGVFGLAHRALESGPRPSIEFWSTASREAAVEHRARGLGDGTWVRDPAWRPSATFYHPAVEQELDRALAVFGPDVVVIEQLGLAQYLPAARRNAGTVILNAHNVETDLQRQLVEAESAPVAKMVRRQFADRTELLEHDTLERVDQVWVCSKPDRALLAEYFGTAAHVVPNAIPVDAYRDVYATHLDSPPAGGPRLVFPAQFAYLPNENGALFLLDDILPAILAGQPSASLVLPGRDPSSRIIEGAVGLPVTVPGAVPTMEPFLRSADVMVIPLKEGSGTRLKALEAFAAGLPVVSTAKGMEGLGAEAGVHYLAAETPEDFASAIRHICEPGVASRIRRAAYTFVQEKHSATAVAGSVDAALRAASVTLR